jgi:hypothetical protein
MAAPVVVIVKKAAVAIATNPKARKVACGIIIGAVLILLTPIGVVLELFNGNIEVDTDRLYQMVSESITPQQRADLQHIADTVSAITTAMTTAGYPNSRVAEAHVLYTMALTDHSREDGFVDRLVSCFAPEQTDAQLVAEVNRVFNTAISREQFENIMGRVRATQIDTSGYTDPATKNNLDLVQWAKAAERNRWGYVWGTFGQVLDNNLYNAKLQQYPEEVGRYADFIQANWLGGRTADCVGFIKGYSWLDANTLLVGYAVNGMPDISADQMYDYATEKGSIDTIPEIPGLAVWHEGHIGIYIGGGVVIEAKGTRHGVVQTQLANSSWTHWLKIPYINYVEPTVDPTAPTVPSTEPTTPTQ